MLTVTYTGTTNWTCPAGVTSLTSVVLYGGGGGGGGGSGPSGQGGAGGGGGGCTAAYNVPVTPGNVYHVAIGTGGSSGGAGAPNGSAGGNGGNGFGTVFPADTGNIVAYGGTGGPGAHATGQPVPSGGTGTWPGGEGAWGGGTGGCGAGGAGGTAGPGGAGNPSSGRNPGTGGVGSNDAYAGNGAGGGWGSTANNGTTGGAGAAYGGGGAGGGGGTDAHTWGGGHGGGGLAVLTYLPVTGGGTYTVGGTVSGLVSGGTLILADGDGNQVPVTANGTFTFPAVTTGTAYAVTVVSAPAGQTAAVTAGTGTVGSANITTVTVTCTAAATWTVGGTVTGLTGTLVLQNNGTDTLTVTGNGAFTFPAALVSGAGYNVTVLTVPAGQTVTIGAGGGTIAAGNVTTVTVTCTTGTGPAGPGPGPLTVTPQPVPAMSVAVSAGYCAVPHPTQGDGVYLFGLTAQAALTVAANPATVARTDIVIAKVYDLASASSYADVEIISGTPGAGQPATPAVSILLGAVTVPPSATAISAANITDLRSFTAAPGGILPATVTTAPPLTAGQVIYDTASGSLKRLPEPVTYTKTFAATTSWISPYTGLVWASGLGGSGGAGGGYKGTTGTTSGGGGSGGGEWAGQWIGVTAGSSYPVTIGAAGSLGHGGQNPAFGAAGGPGTATTFVGDGGVTLTANGGLGGEGGGQQYPAMGGQGGLGSTSAQHQPGGAGGAGAQAPSAAGGGGGASGSPGAPGGAGGNAIGTTPGAGGLAGPGGGDGGRGAVPTGNGATANDPGAGAGGGGADDVIQWNAGGAGKNGTLTLSWTVQPTTLTAVATTVSSDTTTPGQYLSLVSTGTAHGRTPGSGSGYGWGIGYGHSSGATADGIVATEIQVSFVADGRTDYQLDARWGIVIPEAAVDLEFPAITSGRCQIIVMIDNVTIDTVWLNCAANAGATTAGDSSSFTCWTSTKNGTRPAKGTHTAKLAVKTLSTTSGGYSGAHVGDLASVGAAPFGAAALPGPYLATLVAEQSYLRVSGISSAGT